MFEFKLPEIGEGVIEGELVRWLRQPGESVEANQALVEVMTDKATIEVPSPIAGVLTSHSANEGEICAIGAVICEIDQNGTVAESVGAQSSPAAPEPPPAPNAAPAAKVADAIPTNTAHIPATPAARHLARENNIDLNAIGLNASGRITKREVLEAASSQAAATKPAPASTRAAVAQAPAPSVSRPPSRPTPGSNAGGGSKTVPFRGMRRQIANTLAKSYSTAVHFTYVEEINATELVELRTKAKKSAAEVGVSMSFLPFIFKAVARALEKYPIVNSKLDADAGQIVIEDGIHIGLATATDNGLMAPVIRDVDKLSLLDIAREITRLSEGARSGTLAREDLTGRTFTISSLGTIGGLHATPIINYPEVGILGVHAIRKTPVVGPNDEIVVGRLMNLSTSFDHRVVDGFEGASFLQEVRRYLEDPTLLLLAAT